MSTNNTTTEPSATIVPIDLTDKKLLENLVHDWHRLDATFVVGSYDAKGKRLGKFIDHPFTRLSLRERDTQFQAWRAKNIQSAAAWRVLTINPTPRLLSYLQRLKLTVNLVGGKLDASINALL